MATPPLTRQPEFLKFWLSEIIGELAAPITGLAIPLIAISMLHAGAGEMGWLGAMRDLPFLVFGLLAGVLVDRRSRIAVLIACSMASAILLALIPIASWFGMLSMPVLYAQAFAHGSLGVVFAVASQSLVPTLAGRQRLVEANRNLQITTSAAGIVGPGVAGALIQAVTAPVAILIDAASYVVSALLLVSMRVTEPALSTAPGQRVIADIREGLRLVLGDTRLRSIMLCGATHNIFSNGLLVALYVLFATQRLGLAPIELGIALAAGGPGSLLGGLVVTRVTRAIGLGNAIGAAQLLTGAARASMPLALLFPAPLITLAVGEFFLGMARTIFNVNHVSLRQAVTPDHQQGRMNASVRFLMWVAVPLGALGGGWLGETAGIELAVTVGAVGTALASLWILLTPVRSLRAAP